MVSSPGDGAEQEALYVFGPRGNPQEGKDDSIQIVFFRVPAASTEGMALLIWDPASGGAREVERGLFRSSGPIETEFTVYGGDGAFSDAASRTHRPMLAQPGIRLTNLVVRDESPNRWVELGTFPREAMETVGDHAYLKLVVVGRQGSSANYFRVGVSRRDVEIFAYDISLHLATARGAEMAFDVEVPAAMASVTEYNYDTEHGATPHFDGRPLKPASSGQWIANRVTIEPGVSSRRLPYRLVRGTQGLANCSFHVLGADGQALPIFLLGKAVMTPPPAPPQPARLTGDVVDTELLQMSKSMIGEVPLGGTFEATIRVAAKVSIQKVVVTDLLPPGLTLLASEPTATLNGDVLVWTYASLEPGEIRQIVLRLRADKEGALQNCATIIAEPVVCIPTSVGRPVLALTKTGPAQVEVNSTFDYRLQVENVGTVVARDTVVVDRLPDGLEPVDGERTVRFAAGDLEPGERREFAVPVKAPQRGTYTNRAVATAVATDEVAAEAVTRVVLHALEIAKTGPAQAFLEKQAAYRIVVHNPGDVDLHDLVVTDTAPAGTRLLAAEGAAIDGNTATWRIPTLKAGEKLDSLAVLLTASQPGDFCNRVRVVDGDRLEAVDEACTTWRGYPALLLEVVDSEDALLPGQPTVYTVTVTNQGTAADNRVKVELVFPEELTPTEAGGDTRMKIDGRTVIAEPAATIAPRRTLTWKITAKAEKTGDARVKTALTSELLRTPVVEEESTQIY